LLFKIERNIYGASFNWKVGHCLIGIFTPVKLIDLLRLNNSISMNMDFFTLRAHSVNVLGYHFESLPFCRKKAIDVAKDLLNV